MWQTRIYVNVIVFSPAHVHEMGPFHYFQLTHYESLCGTPKYMKVNGHTLNIIVVFPLQLAKAKIS